MLSLFTMDKQTCERYHIFYSAKIRRFSVREDQSPCNLLYNNKMGYYLSLKKVNNNRLMSFLPY